MQVDFQLKMATGAVLSNKPHDLVIGMISNVTGERHNFLFELAVCRVADKGLDAVANNLTDYVSREMVMMISYWVASNEPAQVSDVTNHNASQVALVVSRHLDTIAAVVAAKLKELGDDPPIERHFESRNEPEEEPSSGKKSMTKAVRMETPLFTIEFMPEPKEINSLEDLPDFSIPLVNRVTAEVGSVQVRILSIVENLKYDLPTMERIVGIQLYKTIAEIYGEDIIIAPRPVTTFGRGEAAREATMDDYGSGLIESITRRYQPVPDTGTVSGNNEDGYRYNFHLKGALYVTIVEAKENEKPEYAHSLPNVLTANVDVNNRTAIMRVRRHGAGELYGADIINLTMLEKAIIERFDQIFGRLIGTVSGGLHINSFARQATEEELKDIVRQSASRSFGVQFSPNAGEQLTFSRSNNY